MKYLKKAAIIATMFGVVFLTACKSDSSPKAPSITLESETMQGKAGETISLNVSYDTPEGFDKLVIEKKLDGSVLNTETITNEGSGSYLFEYLILVEDVDGILSFSFTVYDQTENTATKDLVVEVELTPAQLLTKYNWLLSEEIRHNTNENDITDAYTDDVYRFNTDGTYDKSIGEKADDFGDLWYNYCYYNLSDENVLIMTRTGAFGEDVGDTLYVTEISADEFKADVTYYGLDEFNDGTQEVPYEAEEEYTKIFVAQPKGDNFDPYGPGSEDDGGPAGMCNEVTFD